MGKISATSHQASSPPSNKLSKKLSKEEILAKVKGKFGKTAAPKKTPPKSQAEISNISDKAKAKSKKDEGESVAGDIKNNDPNSVVTQEKLKNILKTGAFNFSDQERQTLSKILKM